MNNVERVPIMQIRNLFFILMFLFVVCLSGCGPKMSDEDYQNIVRDVKLKTMFKVLEGAQAAAYTEDPVKALKDNDQKIYGWQKAILEEVLKKYDYTLEDFKIKHEKVLKKQQPN